MSVLDLSTVRTKTFDEGKRKNEQQQTGVHSGIIGPSLGTNNCGDKSLFPLRDLLSCHDSDSCPASKVSFVSGAFILGAMLANLSGSAVSRRIGLKGIIALSAIILQIGTYGTIIFSGDEITFAVWRFVVGLAVGQLSFCVPFWLSQNSPPDSRGYIMGLFPLAIVSGIFLIYLYGLVLGYTSCDGDLETQWKLLYGGGGGFVAFLYLLSVVYMLTRQSEELAQQQAYETPTTTTRKVVERPSNRDDNTIHWFLFAFGIAACQQLSGINAIISYTPGIFSDAGAPNPVLSSTLTNLVNVFGTFFSGYLVDTRGRRPLLLKSLVLMTTSLFLVSLTSALITLISDDTSTLHNVLQIAVIPLLMLYFLGTYYDSSLITRKKTTNTNQHRFRSRTRTSILRHLC